MKVFKFGDRVCLQDPNRVCNPVVYVWEGPEFPYFRFWLHEEGNPDNRFAVVLAQPIFPAPPSLWSL